ncbi:MAG: T9SS type A sorting domain-containing protein [Flavobacteriales bacterium]|nr:T9SS type A sorting domain-containing protein [Flavobacteriales bacterium]
MVKHLLILLMGLLTSGLVASQEVLQDLSRIGGIFDAKTSMQTTSRIDVLKHPFIYVIDTLELPFFDDFSTYRIKEYNADFDDANVSLKINYDFSVNGANPIELDYMEDTTFSILKLVNGQLIPQSNPTLFITFYQNGKPIGQDTGWTNVLTEFDQGTGLVTFDTLFPERSLINEPDTFFKVADNSTLWTWPIDSFDSLRSIPFINNRFAKTPLTQGVATFDGTKADGYPYDISSATSFGLADVLTSKPLRLDSNMENVYLSFFYQAGGHGNYPDEEDSLVVEFFDVVDSTWRSAHRLTAPTEEDSNWTDQVFIAIDGRKYLQSGFRFRFMNYATLSGNFDQWHVDYVRVGKNRDTLADDSIIRDAAFVQGIQSMLMPYHSVPYSHYLTNPAAFEADDASFTVVNLGTETVILIGLQYEIMDPSGNVVGGEITAAPAVDPRTRLTTIFPISDSPLFPDLGTEYADFQIRSRYTSVGQENTYYINDTNVNTQRLRDYYAYDDGTAEKAYGLTGAGLDLAYGFNTPIGDSLRAVLFNFPQILHDDNEELPIRIMVWDDLDAPPIYEGLQWIDPQYTAANEFFRLDLDDPVFVQGDFFVGFRQQESKKIYIGFDVNNKASKHTHYRIGETWFESNFKGALMIRPSFSKDILMSTVEISSEKEGMVVFPNPATQHVQIKSEHRLQEVSLHDLSGRMIRQQNGAQVAFDLSGLVNGVYLIRGIDEMGAIQTQKLIIQK